MTKGIRAGCRVTLHFTLALKDGVEVDSTRGQEPAVFHIGRGELVDILEERLLGLAPGARRHFEIAAEETARGSTEAGETRQRLARSDFPPDLELSPGQVIGFAAPNGEEVPGWVQEVTDSEVVVDFGHPLIGRDLVFDVEILAVEPG
jgi:FKBP-type peptidyl-prolyl cis-trans isomerase SlpA